MPELRSSIEYQDFIEHKIANIKTAISKIKSSAEKPSASSHFAHQSVSESPRMMDFTERTPQASVRSNIQQHMVLPAGKE